MRTIELSQVEHNFRRNDIPVEIEPTVTEDSLFVFDGKPIGFFLLSVDEDLQKVLALADSELRSSRVPKSSMNRVVLGEKDGDSGRQKLEMLSQYSCILGSIPAKPHVRRIAPNISSVHRKESAKTFIKAMLLCAQKAGEIIEAITPEIYKEQKKVIEENVDPRFRFSELFTSSISNCNIAANYHQDNANLPTVNVIFTKRRNSKGGNLTVPDYNATMDCKDNSIIVYPAYRNLHGVTPIVPTRLGGYRNSLVFYALRGLKTC